MSRWASSITKEQKNNPDNATGLFCKNDNGAYEEVRQLIFKLELTDNEHKLIYGVKRDELSNQTKTLDKKRS